MHPELGTVFARLVAGTGLAATADPAAGIEAAVPELDIAAELADTRG